MMHTRRQNILTPRDGVSTLARLVPAVALLCVVNFFAPTAARSEAGPAVPNAETGLPGWSVTPSLPWVGAQVTFRPADGEVTETVDLTVRDRAGEVVYEERIPADAALSATWVPQQTGFYELTARKSDGGTVTRDFPVVWRPLHFPSWPRMKPAEAEGLAYLSSTVIAFEDDIEAWKRRGARVLVNEYYRSGAHVDLRQDDDAIVENLYKRWRSELEAHPEADGLYIDEFSGYPDKKTVRLMDLESRALARLRKAYPDHLIYAAAAGTLRRERAVGFKRAGAVGLLEAYEGYITGSFATYSFETYLDKRIETARHADLLQHAEPDGGVRPEGAVFYLSANLVVGGAIEEPTIPRLESRMRHIKRHAPEMPGIGFYNSYASRPFLAAIDARRQMDRLIEKYYIKPVISLRGLHLSDYDPNSGAAVRVHPVVHNVGGMDAHEVGLRLRVRRVGEAGAEVVDETTVERIGTGVESIRNDSDELRKETRGGNDYYVLPDDRSVIFRARHTAALEWTPAEPGHYELSVEVLNPEDGRFTVLDGLLQETIQVRP